MNLEENTNFFRESFKGFNKDDVTAFIQKLSRDYAENEEKYKERIAKLTAESKSKSEEIEKLDETLKLQENEKTSAREFQGSHAEVVNELSVKIAELSAQLEESKNAQEQAVRNLDAVKTEKDAAAEDLKNEIENLKNQLELNKSKTEDEQKIYENITADLGGVIYTAKKSAEDIAAKAKAEAADILAKSKAEAEEIISRANIKKFAILEENERNIEQFKTKYNYIKVKHDKVIENFKSASDGYSASLEEIKEAIDNISKNI